MAKHLIYLLSLMLVIAGCGKSSEEKAIEKTVEKATGADADVDLSNKRMKISGKTEKGAFSFSTGEGAGIPKDFPADVLVYRPSEVVTTMNIPEGQSLVLTTSDESTKVAEVYKREMTAKGWSEQTSMNVGGQSILAYKKENRVANVTTAPMDGKTQITVMVTKE